MAICNGVLVRGTADAEMTQTIAIDPAFAYDHPRLAPEGDRVFFSHTNYTTYKTKFIEFAWTGTELVRAREYLAPIDYQYGEYFSISTPSRGPDRHIVYTDYNNTSMTYEVVEIADGGGTFVEVARYPLTELGAMLGPLDKPSLSPDGLRLVFLNSSYATQAGGGDTTGGAPGGWCEYAGSVVMYADRATTTDHFGAAQLLATIPEQVDWPYMTADCGRMYVSALNRIFYFKQ